MEFENKARNHRVRVLSKVVLLSVAHWSPLVFSGAAIALDCILFALLFYFYND